MKRAHTARMSPAAQYAAISAVPFTIRSPVSSYLPSMVYTVSCPTLTLSITAMMGESAVPQDLPALNPYISEPSTLCTPSSTTAAVHPSTRYTAGSTTRLPVSTAQNAAKP